MLKRGYITALNRLAQERSAQAAAASMSSKGSEVASPNKDPKPEKATADQDLKSLKSMESRSIRETDEKLEVASSLDDVAIPLTSAPEACPTHLIEFQNNIVNKKFKPHPINKLIDVDGRDMTQYARFQIKDYAFLLQYLETNCPRLPSFIDGPKKGFKGVLYVGSSHCSCEERLVVGHKVKYILLCTKDKRLGESHFAGWKEMDIKVMQIELDSKQFIKPEPPSLFARWFCCTAAEGDPQTEMLRGALEFIREGLKIGGVLLCDLDGFSQAAAMAGLYLAVSKRIPYEEALAIVKSKREHVNPPKDAVELISEKIADLGNMRPEKKV
mmetsp:Transcript_2363/g.4533  ORF Transcript_2363/g.4533 Transcript_2363/m.4533 type:complete len:328 (-) Transcript_2363:209-1192(-)